MKHLLISIMFLLPCIAFANMASPLMQGTEAATAIASRDIDVLYERLFIEIDDAFETAFIQAEYDILVPENATTIPLLFLALQYDGDFAAYLNDKHIETNWLGDLNYQQLDSLGKYFTYNTSHDDFTTIKISWSDSTSLQHYRIDDCVYLDVPIRAGKHTIRVEYTATKWTDLSELVRQDVFKYSLTPARYWKSFGGLECHIKNTESSIPITTNLGAPDEGTLDSIAIWHFQKLPLEVITIRTQNNISQIGKIAASIHASGFMYFIGFLLIGLHIFLIRRYRKTNPTGCFSLPVALGSLFFPAITLSSYLFAEGMIDTLIGQHASRFHGYSFLIIFLYVFLMPIWSITAFLLDLIWRKKSPPKQQAKQN